MYLLFSKSFSPGRFTLIADPAARRAAKRAPFRNLKVMKWFSSWSSWLGIAHGRVRMTTRFGQNNRLTGTWSFGLRCTSDFGHSCYDHFDTCQNKSWPVSRDHIRGRLATHSRSRAFWSWPDQVHVLDRGLMSVNLLKTGQDWAES